MACKTLDFAGGGLLKVKRAAIYALYITSYDIVQGGEGEEVDLRQSRFSYTIFEILLCELSMFL